MKKILLFLVFGFIFQYLYSQEYRIGFSGTGESRVVDSVKVENQTKGTSALLKGSDILVLKVSSTGIPLRTETNEWNLKIWPNPVTDHSLLELSIRKNGNVNFEMFDIAGKILSHTTGFLLAGRYTYMIRAPGSGLYTIRIRNEEGIATSRFISVQTGYKKASVEYSGFSPLPASPETLKGITSEVVMSYNTGDLLKVTGKSDGNSTVVMLTPDKDQTVQFRFMPCMDPGGRKYAVVQIGTQMWMVENLAWLPAVSPPSSGSAAAKYYYVYGYNGNDIISARATENFRIYGVLYNWPAAVNGSAGSSLNPSGLQGACPTGWHLPSDAEWKQLEIQLGMTQEQADATGYRGYNQGSQLKNVNGWNGTLQGTNVSGFSALPGGNRSNDGNQFVNIGDYVTWWTATEQDATTAWYRYLHKIQNTVNRTSYNKENGYSIRCVQDFFPTSAISTSAPQSVTDSSAILGGNILSVSSISINERGVCYSVTPAPTVSDHKIPMGSGTGSFGKTITGFSPATTYYVRAFASHALGTTYGNQVSFTTKNDTMGYFTDTRDNTVYKWIKIGRQRWMAANLAYLPAVFPPTEPPLGVITGKYYYVYGYSGTDVTAAKANENYKKYGVLYNNKAAMEGYSYSSTNPSGRQCICPAGWHLPSDAEWDELAQFVSIQKGPYSKITDIPDLVGSWSGVGKHLKSTTGWQNDANGTDDFGFTGLPGGTRDYLAIFSQLGLYGRWWSTTLGNMPYSWSLPYNSNNFNRGIISPYHSISIRCLRD